MLFKVFYPGFMLQMDILNNFCIFFLTQIWSWKMWVHIFESLNVKQYGIFSHLKEISLGIMSSLLHDKLHLVFGVNISLFPSLPQMGEDYHTHWHLPDRRGPYLEALSVLFQMDLIFIPVWWWFCKISWVKIFFWTNVTCI